MYDFILKLFPQAGHFYLIHVIIHIGKKHLRQYIVESVAWCFISLLTHFHKYDIFYFIHVIIHREKIIRAMYCQMCAKLFYKDKNVYRTHEKVH